MQKQSGDGQTPKKEKYIKQKGKKMNNELNQ